LIIHSNVAKNCRSAASLVSTENGMLGRRVITSSGHEMPGISFSRARSSRRFSSESNGGVFM